MSPKLGPVALTELRTEELKKLLTHIYKGEAEFPLNAQRLACIGFQYRQEQLMHVFRGMSKEAAQSLLVCVIAERINFKELLDKIRQQHSLAST